MEWERDREEFLMRESAVFVFQDRQEEDLAFVKDVVRKMAGDESLDEVLHSGLMKSKEAVARFRERKKDDEAKNNIRNKETNGPAAKPTRRFGRIETTKRKYSEVESEDGEQDERGDDVELYPTGDDGDSDPDDQGLKLNSAPKVFRPSEDLKIRSRATCGNQARVVAATTGPEGKKRVDKERPFHEGQKLNPCLEAGCDAKFGSKFNLTRHVDSVHLKLKPHSCPVDNCPVKVGHKFHLAEHVNEVHLKLKPHSCLVGDCSAKFGHKSKLTRHMDAVHLNHKLVSGVRGCTKIFTYLSEQEAEDLGKDKVKEVSFKRYGDAMRKRQTSEDKSGRS